MTMMRSRLLLASVAAAATLAAGARQDRWEVVGPGGGGAMYYPTISPHDSSRVLLRCDMTGSYITNDAGESWRMFNLRTTTSFFVFDPVDPETIYTYSLGLWRSTDGGKGWSLVYPKPETVTGVRIAGDHGEESIQTEGAGYTSISALAVDPADSRVLYAAIGPWLHVSKDWGETWDYLGVLSDGASQIHVDPASPADNRTVYIIGNRSVTVWENGILSVRQAPEEMPAFTDAALGFPEGGAPVVYATAGSVMIVSEDGGSNWQRAADLPGTDASYSGVGTSLFHPDTVYLSYSNLTEPDGRYWFGVARSNDRGRTWEVVWKSGNKSPENIEDGWLPGAMGAGWAGPPIARGLGVAPNDPNVVYGTDYGRAIRSLDGGQTWQAAYSGKTEDDAYNTRGLDVTTAYGLHWDPFDANRVFISYTDVVLFRSETGGKSWLYSGAGVTKDWRNTVYWMEFDPEVPGRVWAAMSSTHDLPRPKMWRSKAPSTYQGGIALSEDGGKTWRKSSEGMPQTAATHILLDPTSPADARVLYAAGFGRGVYKSSDGGQSWELKNNGLQGDEPFAWRLVRDSNGTLYLVVARRSQNGTYGDGNDGALYRSTDGAESWTRMPLPEGLNGPNGLAIDPDDPQRLYLAAWGRYNRYGDTDGGVFVSTDGGETWNNTLSADQHVYDVTMDKRNGVLYAAGFESSAWRSADRGETWQRIKGYNFKWGHRVVPDPQDPALIYITTFGGSVWHGPAEGDADAVEDIVSPAPMMFTRP